MQLNKKGGFSLIGSMLLLIMVSIAMMAAIPFLTMRSEKEVNVSKYTQQCIITESAADLESTACAGAVAGCKAGLDKDCQTLFSMVGSYQAETHKVARDICDDGGTKACKFLMDQCVADSSNCDLSTDSNLNDVDYYLDLDDNEDSSSESGRAYIETLGTAYYNQEMTNFVSAVNTACDAEFAASQTLDSTACQIKGKVLKTDNLDFDVADRSLFTEEDSTDGTDFTGTVATLQTQAPAEGWAKKFPGGNSITRGNMRVDSNGDVYWFGRIEDDPTLVKIKGDGTQVLWAMEVYDTSYGYGMAIDSSDNIYVIATEYYSIDQGFTVVKFNSSGTVLWAQQSNTKVGVDAKVDLGDIYLDSSENPWIVANIGGSSADHDFLILKLDKGTGEIADNVTWLIGDFDTEPSDGLSYRNNDLVSIAVDNSGNVYITGAYNSGGDGAIVKLNSSGVMQWDYDFSNSKATAGIEIDSDGNLIVCLAGSTHNGYVMSKINSSTGARIWSYRIGFDSTISHLNLSYDVTIDNSGYIYFIGMQVAESQGQQDVLVVKLEDLGTSADLVWMRTFGGTDYDWGHGIDVDNNGFVYISGTQSSDGSDYPYVMKFRDTQTSNLAYDIEDASSMGYSDSGITVDNTYSAVTVSNTSETIQAITNPTLNNLSPSSFSGIDEIVGGTTPYYVTTSNLNNLQNIGIVVSVDIDQVEKFDEQACIDSGVGTVCTDNSVYAGTYDSRYLFTTQADEPGGIAYEYSYDAGEPGSSYGIVTGATNPDQGRYGSPDNYNLNIVYTDNSAAMACKAHNDSAYLGHTDWYLPAVNELLVLDDNASAIGGFSESTDFYYWSSTENTGTKACNVSFAHGSSDCDGGKGNNRNARCIRSVTTPEYGSAIKWLVSFDGGTQWKKWNGSSWINATTDLAAYDIQANGNTKDEIETGLTNYIMADGENSLDFAFDLYSADGTTLPSVDNIEIQYYPE